ncbi:Uncharacterised protein [Legionella moravica]|uniref:Uncharacterized protein n=1 Tax=Legionella moravica TaxID=39962 RepID=A0A378JYF3_9GAMM|nr:Uncharacterised protein [Legionella moravica]
MTQVPEHEANLKIYFYIMVNRLFTVAYGEYIALLMSIKIILKTIT